MRSCLITLFLSQLISFALPFEREPKTLEVSQRLIEARDKKDAQLLLQLANEILQQRSAYNANDFGSLLLNSAGSLNHLSTGDLSVASNAYYFSRVAREAVAETQADYAVSVYSRIYWSPDSYSNAKDERSFATARYEEADIRLRLWRKIEDAVQAADATGRPTLTADQLSNDPEEQSRVRQQLEASANWHALRNHEPIFAQQTIGALGKWYHRDPMDFDELRGLVEHHMKGSRVTNAWESIVAALPQQLQQQANFSYAKPPVLKARKGLLPAIVPPPRPEPGLPAIARPNRALEAMRKQQAASAPGVAMPSQAEKSESPGGIVAAAGTRPVWPWAVLGLAALAGGWVWLRQRG